MSTRKVLVLVNGGAVELPSGDIGDFGYQTHTHKNWLINGDFRIWQRGTSFTPSAAGKLYTADRWCYTNVNAPSGMTISQQSFALGQTAVPNNPRDYSQVAQTGGGSSGAHTFEQRIEDVTNFAGLNVILSFWAMADANRTLNTQFTQNFGTGGSPSSSVTTSQQANAVTTSWQQFTHQLALPSIAGDTLGTNGDHFLAVQFALPQSTAFTISLANVQLELGFDATDFQRRLPGHELALCQRYFQRAGMYAPFSFDATFEGSGHFALPVPLRPGSLGLQLTTSSPQVIVPGWGLYTATSATFGVNFGSNGCRSHLEYIIGGFTGTPVPPVATPAFLYNDYFMLDLEL